MESKKRKVESSRQKVDTKIRKVDTKSQKVESQEPKSGIARAKKWRAKKRGMPLINEAYLL